MTTQIPPGFAQIALEWRHALYARPAVNVFGVANETGDPAPQAVAEAVQAAIAPTLLLRMDTNVTLQRIRAVIGQDGGPPIIGEVFPALAGQRGMNSPSPALAVRAVATTASGGRRGRGGMFLPWWVPVGSVSETGQITTQEVAAGGISLDLFHEELIGEGVPWYLLHSTGVSLPPPPSEVLAVTVDPVISNQVRRQIRR